MAGYQAKLPNWSNEQAQLSFSDVIRNYDTSQDEALAEMAGHSHAYLGRIVGFSNNWKQMAEEFYVAITILNSVPGHRPDDWIAYYWSFAAMAEEQQINFTAAREAYGQAIALAEQVVDARVNECLLAHELGHVLGLDHPGTAGKYPGSTGSVMVPNRLNISSTNTLHNCQIFDKSDLNPLAEPTATIVCISPHNV